MPVRTSTHIFTISIPRMWFRVDIPLPPATPNDVLRCSMVSTQGLVYGHIGQGRGRGGEIPTTFDLAVDTCYSYSEGFHM